MISILFLLAFVSPMLSETIRELDIDVSKLKSIMEAPKIKEHYQNFTKAQQKSKVGSRMLKGNPAALGEFPFYVLLAIDLEYQCGGSIIMPYWVLTVI